MRIPDLDPRALKELTRRAKQQLRRRMRALRAALPPSSHAERSRAICARISELDVFKSSRSVALFWPMVDRGEVDLREIDRRARTTGKLVYYPFMQPEGELLRTGFRRVDDVSSLAERGQRFLEPALDAPQASRGDIDLVIVPALAADAAGHRLGFGMGFYDATLVDVRPPARALVVVYDLALMPELPREPHDVACDLVITEAREFRLSALACGRAGGS